MRARRFDLYPADFIAGVAGQLEPVDFAVYVMVTLLNYDRLGPIPRDAEKISRLFARTRKSTIEASIQRLIKAGKIDSESDSIAVPRALQEITKSVERVLKATTNGLEGGRPPGKSNTYRNQTVSETEKLLPSPSPTPLPKKEDSIVQPEAAPPRGRSAEILLKSQFEEWYQVYPLHKGRGGAERAFAKALKLAKLDELLKGARRYAESVQGTERRFIAHPATWLNQKRWTDDDGDGARDLLSERRRPQAPPRPEDLKDGDASGDV